jgi:hypothetical protein
MTTARNSARLVAALAVGFLGWLAVGVIHPPDPWLWIAPFTLGLVAAFAAPRPFGLVMLLLGIGVSYPVALGIGAISYLGENWTIYLILFFSAASLGFGVVLLAAGAIRGVRTRSG